MSLHCPGRKSLRGGEDWVGCWRTKSRRKKERRNRGPPGVRTSLAKSQPWSWAASTRGHKCAHSCRHCSASRLHSLSTKYETAQHFTRAHAFRDFSVTGWLNHGSSTTGRRRVVFRVDVLGITGCLAPNLVSPIWFKEHTPTLWGQHSISGHEQMSAGRV